MPSLKESVSVARLSSIGSKILPSESLFPNLTVNNVFIPYIMHITFYLYVKSCYY